MSPEKQKKLSIGVVQNVLSLIKPDLFEGVQHYIRANNKNWQLKIAEVSYLKDRYAQVPDFDGVIITETDNVLFRKNKTPMVLINSDGPHPKFTVPYVELSNWKIMETAVKHLNLKGFQRIGFVSYPKSPADGWIIQREDSFLHYCRKYGMDASILRPTPKQEASRPRVTAAISNWLKKQQPPFAVIAINDVRAMDVELCCRKNGLRIPADIALMGIDDRPMICRFMDPPLTSIALNYQIIGYQASRLLDALLSGENIAQPAQSHTSFTLIERASTATWVPRNPLIEKAITFIRTRCGEDIKTPDICRELEISASTLNRLFHDSVHQTVQEFIQNIRVQKAKELLTGSGLCLKEIAANCGFKNPQYFSTVFRRQENLTPGQYRESHKSPLECSAPLQRVQSSRARME